MRCIIILMCVGLIQAHANVMAQRINLSLQNTTVKQALKEIEKQCDLVFMYDFTKVDVNKAISIRTENESVENVLKRITSETDSWFEIIDKQVVLIPKHKILNNESGAVQQITVSGIITDETGDPMPGVNVVVKGTLTGTVTDVYGKYSINVPDNAAILVFSFIGYSSQEIPVAGQQTINTSLGEDTHQIEEIVVVGYGTQRKKDLTGGVVSISGEKLDQIPATNIAQRLQGQVAGMDITNSNTRPGESSEIRVRGEKSLSGGNGPLIVLDGIPFNGTMNDIDQNSVENISILKDASSAAIYGARAANGVILITSKKGKIGKPVVRYNGYVGVQSVERRYDIMSGEDNIRLLKEFHRDRGDAENIWQNPEVFLNTAQLENYRNGIETDWQDEVFRNAFQQEHQISLSGATESTNYYASLSYYGQDGVVKFTKYKKYAATVNLSQKLGKWLTVGVNTQLNEQNNGGVPPAFEMAYKMSPYASPRDADGNYLRYPMWTETNYYSPFADIDGTRDNIMRSVYTGWYADVKLPVNGLSYRTNFGYAFRTTDRGEYYGSTTLTGEPFDGQAKIFNSNYSDWTWENIVRYDRNFGVHHLDLTGLISAQKTNAKESEIEGKGFLNDDNTYHNIDMAQGEKIIKSDKKETALASYMGRINYNYASRYLLTFTGRYDGYSAFGANNKWAFFPSVAAGWIASQESFFRNWDISQIDLLKLRVSYGANGNQAVQAYQTLTKLTQQDYIYGDGASFAGGLASGFIKGNPNLKWETTYSFNIGLDFGLFQNRLSGNLDFYRSRTKDLLMNRTVAIMNGYTTMMDNVGETESKGFDLALNSINIVKKDFQWNTGLVFSGNWNKIVALREDGKDDIASKWFIGESIRVNYDNKVIGIWQNEEREEAAKYNAVPGDAKLLDANDDGKITAEDKVILGSKIPTWVAGLTNTFSYKNWTFSFFFNGVFKVQKENASRLFERKLYEKSGAALAGIDYWTPENGSTKETRLNYKPVNSHKFYIDASYVRLQDVSLSYNVPQGFTDKLGLAKLMVYVNARNLYTFSKANKYGINPEQTVIGGDKVVTQVGAGQEVISTPYPVARTFVFGVNVTF